jgi:hypothetical protein
MSANMTFTKNGASSLEGDSGKLEGWQDSTIQVIWEASFLVIPTKLAKDRQVVYLIEHGATAEIPLLPW